MKESKININVSLDDDKVPQQIIWSATDSSVEAAQKANAMFLAFWDAAEKSALRIDLWTKEMMVDEMADFYYQVFLSMAETFQRATKHDDLSQAIKNFAADFQKKFIEVEKAKNK